MREIKFRAWTKSGQTMVDLKKITPLALDAGLNQDGIFIPFHEDMILMQYIGIEDVEGTEIYEGDILQMGKHETLRSVVEWVNYGFGLIHFPGSPRLKHLENSISEEVYDAIKHGHRIIGNVYQNPEMRI